MGLEAITAFARQQWQLEHDIKVLEAKVKEKEAELARIRDHDLPEAMAEADVEEFTLQGGYRIKIEKIVAAKISKDRAEEAFEWLRKNGHESLIKRNVSLQFGKGEGKMAEKVLAAMRKAFPNREPVDKRSVHHQTLGAFVREQIADGHDLPFDIFGVYIVDRAKIIPPKE